MIMAGNQQSSQVLIVTHDYEKMADAIAQNVHRGVTLLDSQGWYTKERSKVVMVVCRKRETATILKFVKTIDPDAFMCASPRRPYTCSRTPKDARPPCFRVSPDRVRPKSTST